MTDKSDKSLLDEFHLKVWETLLFSLAICITTAFVCPKALDFIGAMFQGTALVLAICELDKLDRIFGGPGLLARMVRPHAAARVDENFNLSFTDQVDLVAKQVPLSPPPLEERIVHLEQQVKALSTADENLAKRITNEITSIRQELRDKLTVDAKQIQDTLKDSLGVKDLGTALAALILASVGTLASMLSGIL